MLDYCLRGGEELSVCAVPPRVGWPRVDNAASRTRRHLGVVPTRSRMNAHTRHGCTVCEGVRYLARLRVIAATDLIVGLPETLSKSGFRP